MNSCARTFDLYCISQHLTCIICLRVMQKKQIRYCLSFIFTLLTEGVSHRRTNVTLLFVLIT